MEYLASAGRGKLKVKTLYCCWKTWISGLRGSRAEGAAVGSVALPALHQAAAQHCHTCSKAQHTEALLPEGELGGHPVLSGVHTSQEGSGRACRELWGSGQQNWLLLLCKGLESWMCAVLLNARRVPNEHHVHGDSLLEEWMAACSWVPFSIPQSCVCLEGTQARAAACYTDQRDWIRELCKREQQPQTGMLQHMMFLVVVSLQEWESEFSYLRPPWYWEAVITRAGGSQRFKPQ